MSQPQFLYPNFLEEKRVYYLNTGFWKRAIAKIAQELGVEVQQPFYNTQFNNGQGFLDGNPIYSAYFPQMQKSLRIIQEEPESEQTQFAQWQEGKEADEIGQFEELVISLELSQASKTMALETVRGWLR